MANKIIEPSILPGFMELLPQEQVAFNKILQTIIDCYELFGFVPLDTPVIEKAEILKAKGGEETEKQLYEFKKGDNDLALRFDLTVPLARYVAQHSNDIYFPFRRYQIGKVYRGEKPQKGRFREFYQCDIDIIGRGELSLFNDAEILAVIYYTFKKLDFGKFLIRINNRKILTGFVEELGLMDSGKKFLQIVDKLEKIGPDAVVSELNKIGLNEEQILKVGEMLKISGDSKNVISKLEQLNFKNETFLAGLFELKEVTNYVNELKVPEQNWKIDLTIARGLDYYTGTVYETILTEYSQLGSVCGGGRYDNLAEQFSEQKMPGVGVSIGLTRMFSQLKEFDLVKKSQYTTAKVLVIPTDSTFEQALDFVDKLREKSINTEFYSLKNVPFRKKFEYANKIGVQFAVVIGEDEVKSDSATVKNMVTGDQETHSKEDVLEFLTKTDQ